MELTTHTENQRSSAPQQGAREAAAAETVRVYRRFPNGKIWPVEGTTVYAAGAVPDSANCIGDEILDVLSEWVTGSTCGLESIWNVSRGNEYFEVQADIAFEGLEANGAGESLCLEDLPIVAERDALRAAFKEQYGLNDIEASHAIQRLEARYSPEHLHAIHGSVRDLHAPASPQGCTYTRVVVNGLEIAYWEADEFREAPESVLGALITALYNFHRA